MKIGVSVKKNHCVCDRNPYLKAEYFIIYGEGTEKILTTLETAVDQGYLVKKGAWIYWYEPDGETIKYSWQGKEKFRYQMREQPELLEELMNLIEGNNIQAMTEEEVQAAKSEEAAVEASMETLEKEAGIPEFARRSRKKAG